MPEGLRSFARSPSPDRAKKILSVLSVSLWLVNKGGHRNLVSTLCGAEGIGVKGFWRDPEPVSPWESSGGKMRIMQPATIVLMVLLVAMTVACATSRKQPNSYEECISLCSDEVSLCTRSCYHWKWSESMDCVQKCNQKSAECRQQCSTLKERIPEHYDQGGDLG